MTQKFDDFHIKLDNTDYDIIVFGSGLFESVMAAILAKQKKRILVIDIDVHYSSSLKTLTLKDLIKFSQSSSQQPQNYLVKQSIFSNFFLKSDKIDSNTVLNSKNHEFRNYNLDLQPRVLYSESLSTECMRQADMDMYMDFQAIKNIYHFDNKSKKFITVPGSKGEIFKHKDYSLQEKRCLFQLLQTLMGLMPKILNIQIDFNSTAEFDKELEINDKHYESYLKLQDQDFKLFLDQFKVSEKILDIFLYTIVNYEYSDQILTTKQFLQRVFKYVKSIGVHSASPFLYTNYGTGDISQSYSRLAAVAGSQFIINEEVIISEIEKKQEGYEIKTNLTSDDNRITCKQLISGMEFNDNLTKLIKNQQKQLIKEEYLLRSIYIIDILNKDEDIETSIFNIPPQSANLNNKNPLNLIQLGQMTQSTPNDKFVIYSKTVVDQETQDEDLQNKIRDFIQEYILMENQHQIYHETHYIQTKKIYDDQNDEEFIQAEYDDFSIHMDRVYQEVLDKCVTCKNNNDNIFFKNIDKDGENQLDEDENEEINNLLDNLNEITNKNNQKQQQETQNDEQKTVNNEQQQESSQEAEKQNIE